MHTRTFYLTTIPTLEHSLIPSDLFSIPTLSRSLSLSPHSFSLSLSFFFPFSLPLSLIFLFPSFPSSPHLFSLFSSLPFFLPLLAYSFSSQLFFHDFWAWFCLPHSLRSTDSFDSYDELVVSNVGTVKKKRLKLGRLLPSFEFSDCISLKREGIRLRIGMLWVRILDINVNKSEVNLTFLYFNSNFAKLLNIIN